MTVQMFQSLVIKIPVIFILSVGIQFWCSSAPLGRVHGKLLYGHQKIRPEWRAVGPACCTQTPQQVRLCGSNSANTWGHSREVLYVMSSYRQLPSRRLFFIKVTIQYISAFGFWSTLVCPSINHSYLLQCQEYESGFFPAKLFYRLSFQ